ncbi:MAG: glycosyltransferase [Deltaproteobacteria bacterium]|nr:glycosyltransferase [Deltaproteobacteria bacterium]
MHVMPWPLTAGGAQRFFVDLASSQTAYADVHAICPEGGDFWNAMLAGVTVHAIAREASGVALLEVIAPDLVHHHHPSGGWLLAAARRTGAAILGTQHRWRENVDPTRAAEVLPICGPGPGVIRHGVDLEEYRPSPPAPLPPGGRGESGTGSSRLTLLPLDGRGVAEGRGEGSIGIVGRLSPEKIPMSFIDALARRAATGAMRGATWRFVGRGIDRPEARVLERRLVAIPGVEIAGDVPPDAMPGAYRELAVLVVPSVHESVSYAAIEAMACGVPVVARAVEGLPETIGDADLLAETDDALIDAALALRADTKLRETLVRRGRERAERLFDVRRMRIAYERTAVRLTCGVVRAGDPDLDVSVVIPVWNTRGEWLRECVESVASQAGARFEIVLVDDGTDADGTLAELAAWEGAANVRVIRRSANGGVGPALNDGIRVARADLIARIDGDDVMPAGRLARQVAIMRERPGLTLVAGQMIVCDERGREIARPVRRFDTSRFIGAQDFAIAHPTVCVRRAAVLRLGGYIAGHAEDFDLWCRLHLAGARMEVAPDVWAYYRHHPDQQTAKREHGECARELRRQWAARAGEFTPAI